MSSLKKMLQDMETLKPKKNRVSISFLDMPKTVGNGVEGPISREMAKAHTDAVLESSPLVKSVMNLLNGPENSIERLAFEINPSTNATYQSLYKRKLRLLPNEVLKRIAIQDDLVAAIVNTRSQMLSSFGRPQPDRFSTGFKIEALPHLADKMSPKEREVLQKQIERAESLLLSCGQTKSYKDSKALSLGQFLFMQARNAVIFGYAATEMIYALDRHGERVFHSFRPIDAGTIYQCSPMREQAQAVRDNALATLKAIKGKDLKPERYIDDEFEWVQIIDGVPRQVFHDDECLVHNFYPNTDIELDGYPITPLDTVISAVTTHINITTHNKLYFENGRAAKGMLVFASDDVDENVIAPIRQQFQANINGVGKAWRAPVIGIGRDDSVEWKPIETTSRDMEFQYLSDTNARVILSAFQMSPEELAGYGHLSRGTNSQALSECFHPESALWTAGGIVPAQDLLGEKDEVETRVWTGKEYVDARLFKTGQKTLRETFIDSTSLKTSPDHRFRVLNESGELIWKRQEELSIGDLLVINAKPTEGDPDKIPSFRGKKLTPEFCELLGWATGDGSFIGPKARCGGYMKLFYHHDKERNIWENQAKFLTSMGFEVKHREDFVTEEEAERIKSLRGFETVAKSRLTNVVYDTELVRWLHDLGFNYSHEGKTIPAVFHVLPIEYRQAFLKGLFSADGHAPKTGQIVLTIQDDRIREQVRQMLMSLGIRTLGCEGILRDSFGTKAFSNKLFIKDREAFWAQIGFEQAHKTERKREQKWSHGSVPAALATKMLEPVLASPVFNSWDKKTRDNVKTIYNSSSTEHKSRRCITWGHLESILSEALGSAPSWMSDFHLEPVVKVVDHGIKVQMVDVEVFDNQHAHILQGFQVHNSNGEYKMEAARDVGIRPLVANMQNYVNSRILPLIDPDLASKASIKFLGLDAETPEKESTRLQQDMAVHMSMDQVLAAVEKKAVGKKWGGEFLLNPQWQQALYQNRYAGDIMEEFFEQEGASKDPTLKFIRDPMWFQWQELLMEKQQMDAQAQQAQQQPQQQDDLSTAADQAIQTMSKSESQLPHAKRNVLSYQRKLLANSLESFEKEAKQTIEQIVKETEQLLPTKGKK